MADIFGIDIAGVLATAIESAGNLRPGVLSRIVPGTRTSPSAGTNPTTTTHTFQGFVEQRAVRRSGQVSSENMSVVSILAATITPVTTPAVNDTVLIDGTTYTLVELLALDPAEALYEFAGDS